MYGLGGRVGSAHMHAREATSRESASLSQGTCFSIGSPPPHEPFSGDGGWKFSARGGLCRHALLGDTHRGGAGLGAPHVFFGVQIWMTNEKPCENILKDFVPCQK